VAVAISLGLCGIPFQAAGIGTKQTKSVHGNLPDPIERACDAAKTPGEKGAKKRQVNGTIPCINMGLRKAILNQLNPSISTTWFGQVGTTARAGAQGWIPVLAAPIVNGYRGALRGTPGSAFVAGRPHERWRGGATGRVAARVCGRPV